MKVLMLSYNERGKGTWLRSFNLAQELVKLGNQVTLVSSTTSKIIEKSVIQNEENLTEVISKSTFPRKTFHGWDLIEARRRGEWINNQKFDLVHVFEHRPTNQSPALLAQKRGAVMVSDWADWLGRGGSVEQRRNQILKTFLSYPETWMEETGRRVSAACTVINQTLFNKAKMLGFSETNLLLLPNGYFNPELTSTSIRTARNQLGLTDDVFLVGYLGTCFYSDSLLMQDAMRLAASKNQNIKFIQIGQNKFAPKKMINLLSTGSVSLEKLSLFLSACNVFWLPLSDIGANWGRSPYKFGDYLTIGRPIISTHIGDQAEIINENKLGLNTDCSGRDLFEAIQSLESDVNSCEQFSGNSYIFARLYENSWKHKGEKLVEFYYRIMKGC